MIYAVLRGLTKGMNIIRRDGLLILSEGLRQIGLYPGNRRWRISVRCQASHSMWRRSSSIRELWSYKQIRVRERMLGKRSLKRYLDH